MERNLNPVKRTDKKVDTRCSFASYLVSHTEVVKIRFLRRGKYRNWAILTAMTKSGISHLWYLDRICLQFECILTLENLIRKHKC